MPLLQRLRQALEGFWPTASLRTYMVVVILLATVPSAAILTFQVYMGVHTEQAQIEDELARSAGGLAQTVERELASSLDALAVLSQSELFQQGRVSALGRLLHGRPRRDWDSVFLMDGDGSLILDTALPGAPRGPADSLRQLHQRVLQKGEPAISGLANGPSPGSRAVAVALPVLQGGVVRYVLGARMGEAVWERLANSANTPDGAHAGLFDAQERLISYSASTTVPAGATLPQDASESMRGRFSGVHRSSDVNGRPVYAAWHTVALAGWWVRVVLPAGPIESAHRKAIVAALSTSGASLVLGVLLALLVAGRVARPLRQLATQGPAALTGHVPVREIAVLRDALLLARARDSAAHDSLQAKAEEFEIAVEGRPSRFVIANAVALRHSDGSPRGAISALVDITQRKLVEEQLLATDERLRESQHLMELAQEAGHVGFFQYEFANDRLTWTPGQRKLLGVEELPDRSLRHWFERVDPQDRDRIEREFWTACALRRDKQTFEYCVTQPDGGSRWLSSRVMLHCDAEGRACQMTGMTVDITEQQQSERERALLTEHALAARREAEAASRAKDEFLTMLSHELRNPLGAISAAIDVLDLVDPGSTTGAEARAIIARQTRNLAHMMNDLLDVGRVIAGKILIARQPVNLAAVVQRVKETLAITGEARDHELHLELQDVWVDGDAVRIEQVVTNLLTNAIKYTPAGRAIQVSVRGGQGVGVLQVQDAGMGIPAALLPHIFDLFVQGHRTLDRRAGGLGIGLTLVRRLVELHGGTVGVESSDEGSRFTVRLNAVDAPAQLDGDTLPLSRRRKVLVVEDNDDVLSALRSKLELDGHTVTTAVNGIEGLTRLLKLRPEVSIVDIGLPGLTGFELARHARAAGYAGRMIALSGYGAERDAQEALIAGFDAYLVKPVDPNELRASLSAE